MQFLLMQCLIANTGIPRLTRFWWQPENRVRRNSRYASQSKGEKNKVARIWKTKKITWVFLCIKYVKFWSISLELFVECKPVISEKWLTKKKEVFYRCILIFINQNRILLLKIWKIRQTTLTNPKIVIIIYQNHRIK